MRSYLRVAEFSTPDFDYGSTPAYDTLAGSSVSGGCSSNSSKSTSSLFYFTTFIG